MCGAERVLGEGQVGKREGHEKSPARALRSPRRINRPERRAFRRSPRLLRLDHPEARQLGPRLAPVGIELARPAIVAIGGGGRCRAPRWRPRGRNGRSPAGVVLRSSATVNNCTRARPRFLPPDQRRALVQIGFGLLRIERDRPVEIGDGEIDEAAPQLQDAAIHMGGDGLVAARDCRAAAPRRNRRSRACARQHRRIRRLVAEPGIAGAEHHHAGGRRDARRAAIRAARMSFRLAIVEPPSTTAHHGLHSTERMPAPCCRQLGVTRKRASSTRACSQLGASSVARR